MQIKKYINSNFLNNQKVQLPKYIKKVKIDVGLSFNAPVSFDWLEKEKDLVVFGFEPNTQNIETIEGNRKIPSDNLKYFKTNNFKKYLGIRFFILPYALSNKPGEQVFYNVNNKVNKNGSGLIHESGQSSLLEPINMDYKKSIAKVYTLSCFLSKFDWEKISSIKQIKIDAQGEDFKIIYGLKKYIKKIEFISFEINAPGYHGYKNYKIENLKMFLHMIIKGFLPIRKTDSEISYKNIRYWKSADNFYTSGT